MLTAIDVATGASTALMQAPVVVRAFRVSPGGRQLIYVAPAPETLGVVGKEQNDTFVLPIDIPNGERPAAARKLSERGRFSWSPDGRQLLFSKGSRLMALPAGGGGDAKPWRESFTLAAGEPMWSPEVRRARGECGSGDGVHERQVRAVGPQFRRLCSLEPDHAD
jgi:hypothetical protein